MLSIGRTLQHGLTYQCLQSNERNRTLLEQGRLAMKSEGTGEPAKRSKHRRIKLYLRWDEDDNQKPALQWECEEEGNIVKPSKALAFGGYDVS